MTQIEDEAELRSDPRSGDLLFVLAATNLLHGQFRAALKCIDRLEKVDPEYPGMFRLKAKILEMMGEPEMAVHYWSMGQDHA